MNFPLYYLTWNMTNRCNLKCKHCYANSSPLDKAEEIDSSLIKKVINDSLELGLKFFLFTGGEPLLRERDLFSIARLLKKKRVKIFLATNSLLINDRIKKKLCIFDKINISLDAFNSKFHDNIRGEIGAFRKTVKNIKDLKKEGFNIGISMTLQNKNINDVEKVAKFCRKMKIPLTIKRFIPVGRGKEENIGLKKNKLKMLFRKITYLKRKGFNISFNDPLYASKFINNSKLSGCLAGIHIASIKSNGDVSGCTKLNYSFGNIKQQSIKDIWLNNRDLKNLRERKLQGKCTNCKKKLVCAGCRAAAYEAYGNIYAEDPMC